MQTKIIILFILIVKSIYAQENNEIFILKNNKENLIYQIGLLNDSLKKIELAISSSELKLLENQISDSSLIVTCRI
ncbi:MAG: hypothetical protein ABI855_20100, partial [Bacteroidota bacterium]